MYHPPWITTQLMRYIVQVLFPKTQQCNIWACLWCNWSSCCGLWGDSSLSKNNKLIILEGSTLNGSYWCMNFNHAIWSMPHITLINSRIAYTYIYIIILGPLHHWWGTLFRLLFLKTRIIVAHVRGIVGGHGVVCGVIHPCHTWSMSHKTIRKQWDRISTKWISILGELH